MTQLCTAILRDIGVFETATAPMPDDLGSHYLPPGEIVVSSDPCVVTTVLGSCVSVCLTDPHVRIGGVNHFLLPYRGNGARSPRFGDMATRILIDRLLGLGCRQSRLEAKVFGGACMLDECASGSHLGAQNVRIAYVVLWEAGIPVIADDVEGRRGRKLIYHTHDSTAWVRRL